MRDQSDELFDQIVYAVCGLLFGEHPANLTIHQRIVAGALRHGVAARRGGRPHPHGVGFANWRRAGAEVQTAAAVGLLGRGEQWLRSENPTFSARTNTSAKSCSRWRMPRKGGWRAWVKSRDVQFSPDHLNRVQLVRHKVTLVIEDCIADRDVAAGDVQYSDPLHDISRLPTLKRLALAVLMGDPCGRELADCLIEQGVIDVDGEFAAKVKADTLAKVKAVMDKAMADMYESHWGRHATTTALSHVRNLIADLA